MSDLLLVCLSCTQASFDTVQQSLPCPFQKSERHALGGESPARSEGQSKCVSTPEVFQAAFAPRTDAADGQLRQALANPALGFQALVTEQSTPRKTAKQLAVSSSSSDTSGATSTPVNLRVGSHSEVVAQLQTKLQQLGYAVGAIDGLYGFQTEAAVMAFQRSQGLTVDGIVGLETWTNLEKLAPANLSSTGTIAANSAPVSVSPPEKSPELAERNQSAGSRSNSSPDFFTDSPTHFPTNSLPDSRTQRSDRSHPVLFPPEAYPWLFGWAIVYGGGWLVIVKDAVQQQRAYQRLKPRPRSLPASPPNPVANQLPGSKSSADGQVVSGTTATNPQSINRSEPAAEQSLPVQNASPDPIMQAAVESMEDFHAAIPLVSAALEQPVLDAPPIPAAIASLPEEIADEVLEVLAAGEGVFLWLPDLLMDLNPKIPATPPIAPPLPAPIAAEPEIHPSPTEAEKLILTFAVEEHGIRYAYSLIDDADGIFVLRGNKLLLKPQRLVEDAAEKTVTLRRTDTQGQSSEQSFKFQLQKTPQPAHVA